MRDKRLSCIALLILMLIIQVNGDTNTFYINPVIGNDSNDGLTSETAWKTISRAYPDQLNVNGNTTIYLYGGDYGSFEWSTSVDQDYVITYEAISAENPVFDKIYLGTTASNISKYNLVFQGVKSFVNSSEFPADDGEWHYDEFDSAFVIKNVNSVIFNNSVFEGVDKYLIDRSVVDGCKNILISENEFKNTLGGIEIISSENITIYYNYFHDMMVATTLKILGGNLNTLIEGNHIVNISYNESDVFFPNGPKDRQETSWHPGTAIGVRSSDTTIKNNNIHNADGLAQSIMFYANDGAVNYAFDNMVVENNFIGMDAGSIPKFYNINSTSSSPVIIRSNTFITNTAEENTDLYSHRIVERYNPGMALSFYNESDGTCNGSGTYIYNNIFQGLFSLPDPLLYDYDADYNIWWSRERQIEGEEWFVNYGAKGDGISNSIIAVWRSESLNGGPAGPLHGNPNLFENINYTEATDEYNFTTDGIIDFFVNPDEYLDDFDDGIKDYRLASTSAAINAGSISIQPSDSLGTIGPDGFIRDDGPIRDENHHSIGCYEYQDINNVDNTQISITYPQNTTYSSNITAINYTVTNGSFCWYSTDSGTTNSSAVSAGTNWTGLNLGSSTLTVYCDNSNGTIANDSIAFTIDSCIPSLTNTSWSISYANGSCRPDDTLQYIQNLTQYDSNSCGEVANVTYFQENRTEACVYNDTTAPSTNTSINIPIIQQGNETITRWSRNNVSINLTCSDDDGCNNTYYCIDQNNTCNPFQGNITNGSLVNITEDGVNYLRYASDDVNNNTENVSVLIVRKAENPPEPLWTRFKNNLTTNFSQQGVQNITNLTIAVPSKAKVMFLEIIDMIKHNGTFIQPNLDVDVNISDNLISVNSSSLDMLNVSAELTFYNVTFTTPKVQKDGVDLDSSEYNLTQSPNSSNNYTMIINVSGFSTYEVVEGYVAPSNDPPSGGSGGSSSSSAPSPPSFTIPVTDSWQLNNLSKYGINHLNISGDLYRIIVKDISEDSLMFYLTGQDETSVTVNSKALLDVDLDGTVDAELVYDKYVSATMAKIKVRRYTEKEEMLIEPNVPSAPKEDTIEALPAPDLETPSAVETESSVQSWLTLGIILGGIILLLSGGSFVFYEIEHKKRPSCKTISKRHHVPELHVQRINDWLKKAKASGKLAGAKDILLEKGWKKELIEDLIELIK